MRIREMFLHEMVRKVAIWIGNEMNVLSMECESNALKQDHERSALTKEGGRSVLKWEDIRSVHMRKDKKICMFLHGTQVWMRRGF